MTQQSLSKDPMITDPISGKDKQIYISDNAKIRLVRMFDKEILSAHKSHDEKLRLILCRIEGEMLGC